MGIMNRHIFQNILFLLLAIGCTKEPIKTIQNTLIIQGENVVRFNTSRNTLNEGLPAGSTLTFYSQGGIHADELPLSYNGSNWEGENLPEWEDSQQPAVSCSFCPPLYRNHQSFYQDGFLCDQLYAQATTNYGENIHLSFQHLFARIVFNVSSKLNNQISLIEFTPSLSVTGINPDSGEMSYQDTASPMQMEQNEDGIYSFLVPPTTLSIHIQIYTAAGEDYESQLEEHAFSSGYEYICSIKQDGENPGISTVEDFIAFTHLINGEVYENRSLEEFGEKTGETTTYYLLNDLTFTEEESTQVQMIGKYKRGDSSGKGLFNDVFDGKGHCLKNLYFEQAIDGTYYTGLFSGLSATGTIKDLILEQAVYKKTNGGKSDNEAFLAGINQGEINNCILENCTIEAITKSNLFGCLANRNAGTIINCHVNNIQQKNETAQGNAIARYNQGGKIINCIVTNCKFNKTTQEGGLLCHTSINGEIQNCYLKGNEGSRNHAICLQATNTKIRCCYYDSSPKAPIGNLSANNPSDSIMQYGSQQSITEDNLYQILNQWVRDSGAKLYPESSFLLWEKGETLPAILVSP